MLKSGEQIMTIYGYARVSTDGQTLKYALYPYIDCFSVDLQRRSQESFATARLVQLAGTRAGVTRQEAAGKWGKATYSLVRTAKAARNTGA
jgi:hypothetical protein